MNMNWIIISVDGGFYFSFKPEVVFFNVPEIGDYFPDTFVPWHDCCLQDQIDIDTSAMVKIFF